MKARALPRATSSVADSADASDYLRRVFSPMHVLAAVRDYGSPPPTRSLSASRTGKSNFGSAIATVRSATTTRRSSATRNLLSPTPAPEPSATTRGPERNYMSSR
jgi:hypothetical protein